jgi:hypothetical protein
MTTTDPTARIRALNDELRRTLLGGSALITPGVAALGNDAVRRIVDTIALFDDFHHDNDPYQEHDFGSFEAEAHQIFFKIDYYDLTFTAGSEDPGNPRSPSA